MMAQVILYSALAFLIELAASHPYTADLQRYSSTYQNRPSIEAQYPSNPQRPYEDIAPRPYDGVNSHPPPQFQGQEELTKLNQANYNARNQKRNEHEGPPHIQPEVNSGRYINQQRQNYYADDSKAPLIHYTNDNWRGASHKINENQPINVGYPEVAINDKHYLSYPQQTIQNSRFPNNVGYLDVAGISNPAEQSYHLTQNPVFNQSPHQELPHPVPSTKVPTNQNHVTIPDIIPQLQEILKKIEFAPTIPSVPTRNIHLSDDILEPGNDHYIQVEPVEIKQIPVVQPAATHVEQGTPLSASERNLARSGNPVEIAPKPQVHSKPDFISNERIQNVLSTTKHQKRYLVIHPNGKIEHVDSLENIAKRHPNYVLVNAGNIVPGKNGTEVTPPTKPVQENKKPTIEQVNAVNQEINHEPSDLEVETKVTPPTKPVQENKKPATEQTTAVVNKTIPSSQVESSGSKVETVVTPPTKPLQENNKPAIEQATAVANKTIPSSQVESSGSKVETVVTPPTKSVQENKKPAIEQATAVANKTIPSSQVESSSSKVETVVTPPTKPVQEKRKPTIQHVNAVNNNTIPSSRVESSGSKVETVVTPPTKPVQDKKEPTIQHVPAVNNKTIPSSKVESFGSKVETVVTPPAKPVQEKKKPTTEQATAVNKIIPSLKVEPSDFKVEVIVTKTPSPSHISKAAPATSPPIHQVTAPVLPKPAPSTSTATSSSAPVTSSQAVATANGSSATTIASANQAKAQAKSTNPSPINSPKPVTTQPIPIQTHDPAPIPSTPKNIQPSKVEIDKEVLPPIENNKAASAVDQPQNEANTSSSVAVGSSSINVVESTSTSTAETTKPDNPSKNTVPSETFKNLQPSPVVTPTTSAVTESIPQPDKKPVTVTDIHEKPQEASSGSKSKTEAPKVVPVLYDSADDSPKSIDEFILNEASNKVEPNPNPTEKVPDLGDSSILENNPHKPVVWFRTSDLNFWNKLTDKNGLDVVYFFQIHNQPKVVYDTKTTVFPNGTIFEEFTETTWDFEGDEPKVKKTKKITNPKDQ